MHVRGRGRSASCRPSCPFQGAVAPFAPSQGQGHSHHLKGEGPPRSLEILPPPGRFCHPAPKGQGAFVTLPRNPWAGTEAPRDCTTSIAANTSCSSAFSFCSFSRDWNSIFQHRKEPMTPQQGWSCLLGHTPGAGSTPRSPYPKTSRKGTWNQHRAVSGSAGRQIPCDPLPGVCLGDALTPQEFQPHTSIAFCFC